MRGDYDAAPHEIGGHGPRGSSGFSLPKCCVTFPRNVALRHHLATTFRWQGGSAVAHAPPLRHLCATFILQRRAPLQKPWLSSLSAQEILADLQDSDKYGYVRAFGVAVGSALIRRS